MKFQPDTLAGVNTITRHEPGGVWVGNQSFQHHVLVPWQGAVQPWSAPGWDALGAEHFQALAALKPELVILGSGARLRFPQPAWLRALYEARIGVETMDTAAACRTYNVLVAEGREVLAALLVEAAP